MQWHTHVAVVLAVMVLGGYFGIRLVPRAPQRGSRVVVVEEPVEARTLAGWSQHGARHWRACLLHR